MFNHGDLSRDFTYIDDIIEGVIRVMKQIPDENNKNPYYRLFNIGHSQPVQLMDFIRTMENAAGRKAILEMYPMQKGDVKTTYADTTYLEQAVGYKPTTGLTEGIEKFMEWYRDFYL